VIGVLNWYLGYITLFVDEHFIAISIRKVITARPTIDRVTQAMMHRMQMPISKRAQELRRLGEDEERRRVHLRNVVTGKVNRIMHWADPRHLPTWRLFLHPIYAIYLTALMEFLTFKEIRVSSTVSPHARGMVYGLLREYRFQWYEKMMWIFAEHVQWKLCMECGKRTQSKCQVCYKRYGQENMNHAFALWERLFTPVCRECNKRIKKCWLCRQNITISQSETWYNANSKGKSSSSRGW